MRLTDDKIIEIFYLADEFCQEFDKTVSKRSIGNEPKKKPKMSQSEVITIMVLFHFGSFKNMKHFYLNCIQSNLSGCFPKTVSYNRFTELMQAAILPMSIFLKTCCLGKSTGISYVDSTSISVCKNKRIPRHKVFDGIAQRGKSTKGYFFGFKLHYVVNDKGEILAFVVTPGNTDDREPLRDKKFLEKVKGKLYADKGYISQSLTELLFVDGLHLITHIRNNMKNVLMEMKDKILLRKRSIIETINDELKNICSIEHSRHRSFGNFMTNLLSALIAYSFFPKKPAIKYQPVNSNQLTLF